MKNLFLATTFTLLAWNAQAKSDRTAIYGPENAPLVIEEYADFECGYCSRGAELIKNAIQDYDGKFKLVFRNLPLPFHETAEPAARAFSAILLQNPSQAFHFYNFVYKNQSRLSEGVSFLEEAARQAGADVKRMKKEMNSKEVDQILSEDLKKAEAYGFRGTPSFRVGDESIVGAVPYAELKQAIDRQLAKSNKVKK